MTTKVILKDHGVMFARGVLVSGANVWLYNHITAFEETGGEEDMH